jgi:Mlc titration factor MtfA (ptsG expression regulator)
LQNELKGLILVFLHDKRFVGCGGQEIDDEIRVTVAAQACLLLLNRANGVYPELRTVLVYPTTFIVRREVEDEFGLVSTDHAELLGESWGEGKVVLAWDSVDQGVRDPNDGYNVVLHEFAHQLDHETGATNGVPLLNTPGAYRSWARVLSGEFEALQLQAIHGQETLMDDYGATNPAEFFAVATETFFERPNEMRAGHAELFQELVNFYQVDPSEWAGAGESVDEAQRTDSDQDVDDHEHG